MELDTSLKTMRALAPWSDTKRTYLQQIMQGVEDGDLIDAIGWLRSHYFPEASQAAKQAAEELSNAAFREMQGSTYHRPRHAFDVTLAVCELVDDPGSDLALILFLVAIGHDIGHDGRADMHGDFALEAYAAERIAWILSRCGFDDETVVKSRLLTLATNAKYRRQIAHLADMHELGLSSGCLQKLSLPVPLQPLARYRSLWESCAVLADADLFRSTSISVQASKEQSVNVFSEIDNAPVQASHGSFSARRKGFLKAVAGESHASNAGHAFRDALHEIWFEALRTPNPLKGNLGDRLNSLSVDRNAKLPLIDDRSLHCVVADAHGHFHTVVGEEPITVSRSGIVVRNGSVVSVVSGARP